MPHDTPVSQPVQGMGFAIIPNWLVRDSSVSATTKCVFLILSSYAGRDGVCWPHQDTIGNCIGVSPRTVMRAIDELRKMGLVDSQRTPRGNRYKLHMHMTPVSPATSDLTPTPSDTGVASQQVTRVTSIEEEPLEEEPSTTAVVPVVTGVTRPAVDRTPSRPVSLPRGWEPSAAARTSFEKRFGRDIDIDLSLARFVGYYVEHPDKKSSDWAARLAQWLAKDVADVREKRPDPSGPDDTGIPKWLHKRMNGRQEQA